MRIPVKRGLILAAYILFHLFVLREIRTELFQLQVNNQLIERIEQSEELSFNKLDTRLMYIQYYAEDGEYEKIWLYKIPFGSFFFIAMVGLIATGASSNYYKGIIGIHGLVFLITGGIFLMDVSTHFWLLAVCDFLSQYLVPLSSIGVIVLWLMQARGIRIFTTSLHD